MIAIIDAYQAGLLKAKHWLPNLLAGSIVGVVALPLAMAFAIASGVKPEQGLYTAIIAALVVGLFGGTRAQIAGPTGAFVVILANIVAQYGIDGLQLATLLAGIILFFMGFIKLGSVIKFIPDPVIVGFTSGIGVIIFVGEWKDFFGLTATIPLDAHFYLKLLILIKNIPHADLVTTGLALLSLILTLITPRIIKRLPGPLVALVIVTAIVATFKLPVATIGSTFGGIPQHIPQFHFPVFSLSRTFELIGPAFTIALLGAIESLLSATAADAMSGTRHNSNQELIGQGLANILCPLFGGFAATGAIARTATNIRNHGNSPIAAITHSLLLILILVFLAPLAAYIPLCSLAAILFVVAYNMSDIPHFIRMIKSAPRYDVSVLLVTFLLTIFVNLVVAVYIGVTFAMLFFIRRMTQLVSIRTLSKDDIKNEISSSVNQEKIPPDTLVYALQGPFFFGAAEKIEHVLSFTKSDPKIIIFRLKEVPFIDMTGLATFHEIIDEYNKRNVQVYLCEANQVVANKLLNAGIVSIIKNQRIYDSLSSTMNAIADDGSPMTTPKSK